MTRFRPLHLTCALVATSALVLTAAACGSSDSSGSTSTSAAASTAAATTSTAAAAAKIDYDGPEAGLPASYGEPKVKDGYSFTVGWLEPTGANQFVHAVALAGKAETEKLGGKFIELDAGLDIDKQVSQCNQLVAQKVDAIAVYPVDPSALGPCLKQASDAGIKIVGEDTPAVAGEQLLPGYLSSVMQGADRARFMIVQYAAQQDPGATVATLGTALPVPLLQYTIKRSKYWSERFGLKNLGNVDSKSDTAADAAVAMSTILTKYPDVQVVFAFNDPSAEAAAATARAAGNTKVKVYGLSGEEAAVKQVEAGQLAGDVLLNTDEVGGQMIKGIYDALTDQNLPLPKQISPPPTLVTKENAGSVKAIGA